MIAALLWFAALYLAIAVASLCAVLLIAGVEGRRRAIRSKDIAARDE